MIFFLVILEPLMLISIFGGVQFLISSVIINLIIRIFFRKEFNVIIQNLFNNSGNELEKFNNSYSYKLIYIINNIYYLLNPLSLGLVISKVLNRGDIK